MIINTSALFDLKQKLFNHPEKSNEEVITSEILIDFFSTLKPDQVIKNIGGNGLAFVFNGKEKGPRIMFRAEMDAIPVNAKNGNQSIKQYAHLCGHDGHMTILAGLGKYISENKLNRGKVILLYQPAEEIGIGANNVLNDEKFKAISPNYVFGFHNLPGSPLNSIITKEGIFSAASAGLKLKFNGIGIHAAYAQSGINPLKAVARVILEFEELANKDIFKDLCRITFIGVDTGEINFGTSPGEASLYITVRAFRSDDFEMLLKTLEKTAREIASDEGLTFRMSLEDEFASINNHTECVNIISHATHRNGLDFVQQKKPNLWSEDFSQFTDNYAGAMFCLGAGENASPLHTPEYHFPDELIETGVKMLISIMDRILSK